MTESRINCSHRRQWVQQQQLRPAIRDPATSATYDLVRTGIAFYTGQSAGSFRDTYIDNPQSDAPRFSRSVLSRPVQPRLPAPLDHR